MSRLFLFTGFFRWLPLLLAWGAAAAIDAGRPARPELVLSDGDGTVVYSRPIAAGDRFGVAFTHSLALSRVEEFYEVMADGEFRLRETVYADFGAGLPHEEAPGMRMEFGGGRIRLSGYDVVFRELWLRIGHIADHRLLTPDGGEVRLADFRPPGRAIRIRIEAGRSEHERRTE